MSGRRQIAIVLFGLLGLARTETAGAETLEEVLAHAYSTNPQLKAARAHLREVDEEVPRALTGWRPTVAITASAGAAALEDNFDKTHMPEQRLPQTSALTINQPIYTGGRVSAQVKQSEAQVRAERSRLRVAESAVLLSAATAFLDVGRDQQIVALNDSHVAVLERTEHASEQEHSVGALTQADLAQAQARLADARSLQAEADAQLARSRAVFEQVVGYSPGKLEPPSKVLDLPPTRDAAAVQAGAQNFDVAAARDTFDASNHAIDAARAGFLPQVSLRGDVERDKATAIQQLTQRDNVAELDVVVTIPLYKGGETQVATRTAVEAAGRSWLQVDVAVRQAVRQAKTAWDQLIAARRRVAEQRLSISANATALRGITEQHEAGARTLLEVLNAQNELLGAQVNLSVAEHDEDLAQFQLSAAVGELTAERLSLPVTIYDPLQHYKAVRNRWFGTDGTP